MNKLVVRVGEKWICLYLFTREVYQRPGLS